MRHTKGRPAVDYGAALQTAGEVVTGSVTHLPDAWHEQTEWENAAAYADGYAAGYAAAEQAIAEEITRAIGVPPYDRRDVIRWLIRTTGQPAPRRPERGRAA